MNIFRLNLQMERLVPNSLYGPLDPYYAGNLTAVCMQSKSYYSTFK